MGARRSGGRRVRRQRDCCPVRLRGGKRLDSPALIADGNHARIDGFVSLGVVASAAVVGLGLRIADPIIGLVITVVILKITWDSWQTIYGKHGGQPR
ncbi:MAG: cation transporter [Gaiellaceae bacterium]